MRRNGKIYMVHLSHLSATLTGSSTYERTDETARGSSGLQRGSYPHGESGAEVARESVQVAPRGFWHDELLLLHAQPCVKQSENTVLRGPHAEDDQPTPTALSLTDGWNGLLLLAVGLPH